MRALQRVAFAAVTGTGIAIHPLLAFAQVNQGYPTRPVRIVIGFPAGGPADNLARIIGHAVSPGLGQQVVIDNRPGADGALAPELVAKAQPDGHTVLMASQSNMAMIRAMRKALPYDPLDDFIPITFVAWGSSLLVMHPSIPARTVSELIDYARANPGKLNVAAANPATIFAMAQLKSMASLDMVNVSYKGDVNAMPDLLSGRVHLLTGGTNLVLPYVKEGRLRALASLTRNRSAATPDVPTMREAGVTSFTTYGWNALYVPVKTPASIVERLDREFNGVLKRPDIQEQFRKTGNETRGGPSRQEIPAFLKEQIAAWGAAAREAGIQPQ